MKKLLILLLLLPFFAKAQTTYQLNYDSIRVNKTSGLGGTSLYGKVYLKNVGLGLVSDSILTVLNGRIRKVPVAGIVPTLGTSAISLGGTANGLSYLSGNYRLHRVTATTGGVLTTGTDTIPGPKRFTSSPIIATSGSSNLSLFANSSAAESGLILGTGSTNKWQLFKANSGNNEDLLLSNLALARTSLSISSTTNAVRINEIPNVGGSSDSILVHDNTSKEIKRVAASSLNFFTRTGTVLSPTTSGDQIQLAPLTSTVGLRVDANSASVSGVIVNGNATALNPMFKASDNYNNVGFEYSGNSSGISYNVVGGSSFSGTPFLYTKNSVDLFNISNAGWINAVGGNFTSDLNVGTTAPTTDDGTTLFSSGQIYTHVAGTGSTDQVRFYRNSTLIGRITTDGSSTSYVTSSDYRLKKDFKVFNGLDIINKIKIYDYAWKQDNSRAYGVKAHELQELLPSAVFGNKDEINADGSIKPQGVDYSKLVPILIKSIQELEARITVLENK
jgi:hypothetical protein